MVVDAEIVPSFSSPTTPLIVFQPPQLNAYASNDVLLSPLRRLEQEADSRFTTHRWLLESCPKRMIYQAVYGDLLSPSATRRSILDVGGGYSSLSRRLLDRHDYQLLDLMAHDDHSELVQLQRGVGHTFWINSDWHTWEPPPHLDLVIANDLFPNVDQRLTLFLQRYLPVCQEMRLSLTYYNTPRWYQVKRTDADEVFHMMAWDGVQLSRALEPFAEHVVDPHFDLLQSNPASLFANGRQVAYVNLRGARAPR